MNIAAARSTVQAVFFIGATGGNQRFGFGSGEPIPQSVSYSTIPTGFVSQSFLVYIPSGSSMETYIQRVIPVTQGISGFCISPTGTKLSIRRIGN